MQDCETFIRGTYRFTGFSDIISSFHDLGLTSDEIAPDGVKTLRDLLESKLLGVHKINLSLGPRPTSALEQSIQNLSSGD